MGFDRKYLFFLASTCEPGTSGNSEWLARKAAQALRPNTPQTWMHLARMRLAPFVDQRHTTGSYPMAQGDSHQLLQATLQATDLVLVAHCASDHKNWP